MATAYEAEASTPVPRFNRRAIESYLRLGRNRVKGWLTGLDARLIADISHIQTGQGITGGVGEIGVHHGKLFILLYLLTHNEEAAFCIDIFDMQDLNTDRSGRGSQSKFLANLAKHAGPYRHLHLIRASSANVSTDEITAACGPVRLFSIDGGHTAALTKNDMELAALTLCQGGVVIIDDYFQPAWPGVSEGVFHFYQDHPGKLVPFAISLNKVFFCHADYGDFYRSRLQARRTRQFSKNTELLGHPVAVYRHPSLRHRLRDTHIWQLTRNTPAGRLVKTIVSLFANT
ncbi:MAG: class I SAM-dependent methyltransferase [Alphaproteobacteria bacterium]